MIAVMTSVVLSYRYRKGGDVGKRLSRRHFLGSAAAVAIGFGSGGPGTGYAQTTPPPEDGRDLALINGKIHTMDRDSRVDSQVLIRNGRFIAVGNNVSRTGNVRTVNLMGKTIIPGIIDAHDHIVLVGNRPGWHTPLEHVFTIPDAVAALKARSNDVPAGEFITTVGPIAAMQFEERRLAALTGLEGRDWPVFFLCWRGGPPRQTQRGKWLAEAGGPL